MQNFLASDLGKLQLSEEFHLANILVPLPDGSSSATIQAAERQARDIHRQLRQGADFAQLAITRSSSETALEGGDMGWRKAAQLPPPFDTMVSSLSIGEITEPLRTPGGFIILKLLDKRGGGALVREEVHVRHILLKPSEIRSTGRKPPAGRTPVSASAGAARTLPSWRRASPKTRAPRSTAAI